MFLLLSENLVIAFEYHRYFHQYITFIFTLKQVAFLIRIHRYYRHHPSPERVTNLVRQFEIN